jgi:thioredoxin 1
MATVALTAESFTQALADNDIVLVDFWAEWCGPCRAFAPIYEKVSDAHPDVFFGKVDTEVEQDLAGQFGIMSIPTLAIIRERFVLFLQPGMIPEDGLESLISQVKALDMDEVRRSVAEQEQAAS